MILIIEDDIDIAALLYELLDNGDGECVRVSTVREGIKAIKSRTPSVIVTDYMLPDGTGADIVDRFPDIPSIIITAAVNVKHDRVQVIHKPFDLDEVEAAVDAHSSDSPASA